MRPSVAHLRFTHQFDHTADLSDNQVGIVAVCHVDDYRDDIIRKHEKTRPVKEDDRTRLVDALSANTGPIFLTYQEEEGIDGIVAELMKGEPVCDFVADDGIHTPLRKPVPAIENCGNTHSHQ